MVRRKHRKEAIILQCGIRKNLTGRICDRSGHKNHLALRRLLL
jgi:hypothetical protein